jgi:hypothetical protein
MALLHPKLEGFRRKRRSLPSVLAAETVSNSDLILYTSVIFVASIDFFRPCPLPFASGARLSKSKKGTQRERKSAVMKVYLVQHGEAKSEEEDPQRRLTDKAIGEVVETFPRAAIRLIRV